MRQVPFYRPAVIVLPFFIFCQMMQPEVMVVNKISPEVLIRNPSFNGVVWNTVLRYEEATSPDHCLRGEEHVRFQTLDAHRYCRGQTRYSLIDSICMCDSSWLSSDTDVISATPLWFNYRTERSFDMQNGEFRVIELTADDTVQDFSVPGPYGH